MEIRRAGADDWQLLRDVRLRALAEAPSAFGSSFERERHRTDAEWRQWAERGRSGVMFVADRGDLFVGLAGGFVEEHDPTAVHLVSMWVDPSERRGGLGRALIDAVVGWARDRGAHAVNLWVTNGNSPAIALYRSCGFQPTGAHQPLPSNPALEEGKYRLDVR